MPSIKTDERHIQRTLLKACKSHRSGLSTADLSALSGLSLPVVRQAAPLLADEFRGRIQVSERGELIWSFPQGFTSRYTGFLPRLRRGWEKTRTILFKILSTLFKGWILFTLVAYFVLFVLLSIASVVALSAASMAGNNDNRSSRRSGGIGGFYLAGRFIELAMRLWLYSEFTRPDGFGRTRQRKAGREKKTALHQSIFDFVFGPVDPNADLEERQTRAFADFVSTHGGVTSQGEYEGLSADTPDTAADRLLAWCSRFEGRVELDEEGAVLYHFDTLLERDTASRSTVWPEAQERVWSTNKKSLNRAFILINGVNLVFGSYFVWQHLHFAAGGLPGPLSIVYQVALSLVSALPGAIPLLYIGLGLVPLAFSLLFWLIPLVRYRRISRFNRSLRDKKKSATLERAIWTAAKNAKALKLNRDADRASTRILARMAARAETESHSDEDGNSLWRFTALEREARALEKAREAARTAGTGPIIFDSHEPLKD